MIQEELGISYKTFDFSGKDLDDLLDQFSLPLRAHSRRVAVCASIMADKANEYTYLYGAPNDISLAVIAHLGGTCHDIGKLLLPTLISSEEEYRQHPIVGTQLLEKYKSTLFSSQTQAQLVIDAVCYHHERPDGNGFPHGLKHADIPLMAGICALADYLDHHLYAKKESYVYTTDIFNDVQNKAGSHFCESAVMCFERTWTQLREQYVKWNRFEI